MTLHEAMVEILSEAGRAMSDEEIAAEVNRRGSYSKRDGSLMMPSQIRLRASKYPALFVRDRGTISLLRQGDQVPRRPLTPAVSAPPDMSSATGLSDRRRELLRVLDAIEAGLRPSEKESVAGRIGRLTHAGVIPRHLAPLMRAVTEARNVVEYYDETLSRKQVDALEANWAAIKEWALALGVRLPEWSE